MADNDYEEMRRKNIADRQAAFEELFKDVKTESYNLERRTAPSSQPEKRRQRTNRWSDEDRENAPPAKKRRRQQSRYRFEEVKKVYNTRSRTKSTSVVGNTGENIAEDSEGSEEASERLVPRGRSLKVIFPWARTFEREMVVTSIDKWDVDKEIAEYNDFSSSFESPDDAEGNDSQDDGRKRKSYLGRITKSVYDPSTIPSPDEITSDMLDNIVEKSSDKVYCKLRGISCHQCRQKTLDTKTVCRSGQCIGVRGQFCGPCLRGRYGEDIRTVLKDPKWACPPCRGLCNCSICRTRNGQRPTGILAPLAQEEGFTSVLDYLQATSGDEDEQN